MSKIKHHITRTIHWSMAALIITLLALGLYMTSYHNHEIYPLHKSLGVIALIALLIRLYWRARYPWVSSMEGSTKEKAVKFAHLSLLALLTLMPVSGMLLSGAGGYGVNLFGLELIPSSFDENGKAIPFNAALSTLGYSSHAILAYILIALVGLHIAAALKHHFIDKDKTLVRMVGIGQAANSAQPTQRASNRLETRGI